MMPVLLALWVFCCYFLYAWIFNQTVLPLKPQYSWHSLIMTFIYFLLDFESSYVPQDKLEDVFRKLLTRSKAKLLIPFPIYKNA